MDHLWSPWRLAYVTATGAPADQAGCIFCKALEGGDDLARELLHRFSEGLLLAGELEDHETINTEIAEHTERIIVLSRFRG